MKGFKLRGLGQGELRMWAQMTFPGVSQKGIFNGIYILDGGTA